jgi:rubrerythrin
MPNLKGTKTLHRLVTCFVGESTARNRYTFYADIAKNEGYAHIAQVFLETAENERLHANAFYKRIADYLGPNTCEHISASGDFPVQIGDTYHNLLSSAEGEREEYEGCYKDGEIEAKEEGFAEIAFLFRNVGNAEREHGARFSALAERVKNGTVFSRETEVVWRCMKCGHIHTGKEAPKVCPICKHPQAYFTTEK